MRPTIWRGALLTFLVGALSACGGDTGVTVRLGGDTGQHTLLAAPAPAPAPSLDQRLMVERIYVIYLGRPADPEGLDYFASAAAHLSLSVVGADIPGYYDRHAGFAALVDAIAGSAEAQRYLDGDDATFVTALYQHMFNRDPDPAGMQYWAGLLAQQRLSRALAPLAILAAAHADDRAVLEQKAALALTYTGALDTDARRKLFNGRGGLAAAREMLQAVGNAADPSGITSAASRLAVAERALSQAVALEPVKLARIQEIVQQRCLACHSVTPSMPGFSTAPRGIRFDTTAQIVADARRIHLNVVQTEFMPYRNATHMPYAERTIIAAWFESQTRAN